MQPESIDYYNDNFSDNDEYVPNGQDSGQHEVVQHHKFCIYRAGD